MRNKIAFLLIITFSMFILFSCTKKEPVVAFTHSTMKPWFDSYCKSCHGSGASAKKDWYYNADDFNNTVKKYMSDIYKTVYTKKTMPQGTTLTATELQKFKDWYDAGYPVN